MRKISQEPLLSARAAEEIRAAILDGRLPPGSRIRQEELAVKLGVSREPIRHALKLLEQEGLVQTLPRRGTIVAPLDPQVIIDIYEFREAVEGLVAAKLAARRDFDPAPLREIVAQGRSAIRMNDLERLIDLDLAFHTGLYEAAQNRVIIDVMRAQWGQIRRVMAMTLTVAGYRKHVWEEHAEILEAIAERQVSRARALAATHTRGARGLLTAHLPVSSQDVTIRR